MIKRATLGAAFLLFDYKGRREQVSTSASIKLKCRDIPGYFEFALALTIELRVDGLFITKSCRDSS